MRWMRFATAALAVSLVAGCGGDDDDDAASATGDERKSEKVSDPAPGEDDAPDEEERAKVEITARDYGFDLPATFAGGLVDLTLVNTGKELHFAAFAQPAEGRTTEDVRAALTAPKSDSPPAGPPPLVEYAALGTVDPGGESRMTMNLPAGRYVLFCALPAPDGIPHLAKGMLVDVEVTAGPSRNLPTTESTVTLADFAIGGLPEFEAGTNRVTIENRGKQIHELDLVEVPDGKTVEDLVAWAAEPGGPPPLPFLGGPAIKAGLSATSSFELEAGTRYAFVCIVPDSLSDFAPHITKGMHSPVFEVAAGS